MRLKKSGIVYGAKGEYGEWMDNSAMKPIPVLMGDVLRIYFTCRTKDGAGRPGYVDVNPENPSEVLAIISFQFLKTTDDIKKYRVYFSQSDKSL